MLENFHWLIVLGFNATLTAKVISWWSVMHMCFLATFLTCFCRSKGQKYAGKKSCHNWGSNSQPQGHESDTLTTEAPGLENFCKNAYSFAHNKFLAWPENILQVTY